MTPASLTASVSEDHSLEQTRASVSAHSEQRFVVALPYPRYSLRFLLAGPIAIAFALCFWPTAKTGMATIELGSVAAGTELKHIIKLRNGRSRQLRLSIGRTSGELFGRLSADRLTPGETSDLVLHFLARHRHQVGDLIQYDYVLYTDIPDCP